MFSFMLRGSARGAARCHVGQRTVASLAEWRVDLSKEARGDFWKKGFCTVENVLPVEIVERVVERFEDCFAGRFSRGIYPDEWHWREGFSREGVTREIVNAYKCDDVVRDVVLWEGLGRLASSLMGWEGARIGQDDIIWKPPGTTGGVGFHTDGTYIADQFTPREDNSVTLWIALDDADEETGTVEYAVGSHQWPVADLADGEAGFFGHAQSPRAPAEAAAARAGADLVLESVTVPRGSGLLHHQNTWHGSGPNQSATRHRRALAVHFLAAGVEFRIDPHPTYIYGRYWEGHRQLNDVFFPVTYRS
mmetsp:Transcript_22138/g.62241  ORF Transcript_22138/g.62241 Transcript_22138/m.62241 type:complete len:306 (+) Transcript_22138:91-1008(+)|eukprot:CAMPEP_0119121622 /NCGR_PEP_ID=MMETSP1310-20130426/2169_1 /TAXON_ID=464262 /ORGANISM="Genus nov. species nov., Strain RCC2339" /LENGTH=305 /DNA_ID=CAMNT_0007111195 /DNA_START=68 /DNA_END=985 /DNA_ORIENTATION=+